MVDKTKGEEASEVGFPLLPTGAPEPGRGSPPWVGTGEALSHLGPSRVPAPVGLSVTPAWQPGASRQSRRLGSAVPEESPGLPASSGGHRTALWSRPGTEMEGRDGSDILAAQPGTSARAYPIRPALGPLGRCGAAGRRGRWPA